jgi:hypothetical protein
MAVPESTKDYLLKVQREIGRQALARLDESAVLTASKPVTTAPLQLRKSAASSVQTPATPARPSSIKAVAQAGIE